MNEDWIGWQVFFRYLNPDEILRSPGCVDLRTVSFFFFVYLTPSPPLPHERLWMWRR